MYLSVFQVPYTISNDCHTTERSHGGKCSKNLNTFLSLFSIKMLVFRAGIHKMDVRIANSEDPDQTASSEAV